ncbi:unnamed protein product [Brachionus calyciflorus]|uniref:G-protein coupled receptors family 1 profile domain-containing protein n=1 Tax=Brachionus calyciflorus TaxID=104777 RepID=A0A814HUG6_9BILA|nr:unnamed protein product [Brachionus calyciflorus]
MKYFFLIFLKIQIISSLLNEANTSLFVLNVNKCAEFNKNLKIYNLLGFDSLIRIEIQIKNFKNYNEIILDCVKSIPSLSIDVLTLIPANLLTLDNNLNLNHSCYQSNSIKFNFVFSKNLEYNLKIFNTFYPNKNIFINFYFSIFSYGNNLNCTRSFITIFKKVQSLNFAFTSTYKLNTCPFIFLNSDIYELKLNGLSDTLVKKNILSFKPIQFELNFRINKLGLSFYRSVLNKEIFDCKIFNNVTTLMVYGQLKKITSNLFSNFTNLKKISFYLDKLDGILTTPLNWLIFRQEPILIFIDFYTFPNEDFCLFKNLSQNHLILFENFKFISNCSCLFYWLYKTYHLDDGLQILRQKCENFILLKTTCNFEYECKITILKEFNLTIQDKIYESNILILATLLLIPVFAISGLIGNLINLFILKQIPNSKKDSNNIIHKLMLINSLMNLIYCLIYLLHLSNICIDINGIYCPFISHKILTTRINTSAYLAEYYKDYVEFPVKNTFSGIFERDKFQIEERALTYNRQKNFVYLVLFSLNFVINDIFLLLCLLIIDVLLLTKFKMNIRLKSQIQNRIGKTRIDKNDQVSFRVTLIVLNQWGLIRNGTDQKFESLNRLIFKSRDNFAKSITWKKLLRRFWRCVNAHIMNIPFEKILWLNFSEKERLSLTGIKR